MTFALGTRVQYTRWYLRWVYMKYGAIEEQRCTALIGTVLAIEPDVLVQWDDGTRETCPDRSIVAWSRPVAPTPWIPVPAHLKEPRS